MATKDKPGQSSERKKTTMEKGRPSLSLSSVPVEVKSHVVSTKPASKQRRISSSGEEETSEIVNIKGTLAMIQETLKKLVTKEDIKDLVRSVDHITQMNAQLLRKLRSEEREHLVESAWYFNGHIFVLDKRGKRHKMEVTDDIDKKVRV